MADFNELIAVSFFELETTLFEDLAKLFRDAMTEVLEKLDAALAEKRDKQRYVVQEVKETGLETKLGPVRFRRRVYLDRQTGERVYALDEALGLEKRARVSPGLKQAAVREGAEGVSYRGARDSLVRKFGQRMLSHETVRQLVLKAGQVIEEADKRLALEAEGDRKVGVVFVEADGLYVSRQKVGKREERFTVAHQRWRRRSPGSNEYELVNKTHVHCDSTGDIWEETSGILGAKYDLSCPEAMVDYRVRLAELGYDTSGMRGMGSAESLMNDFARRLRKQGRSWGRAGLRAMIRVLIKRFEGKLEGYTRWLAEIGERLDLERVQSAASRIVQETVQRAIACEKTYRMPIRGAGRNASRGLSAFMNRLNQALPRELA